MSTATRVFGLTALAALAGASALHVGVLGGQQALWSPMVRLLLFGWITGFILAVSYHAMPVFLARDFPSPALSTAHGALFALSTAAAAAADLARPALLPWTTGLQSIVGALFAANVVALLAIGRRRPMGPPQVPLPPQRQVDRLASRATSAAGAALPVSLALLAATEAGWLAPSWRLAALHLATLGWVLGMVVGVGYHVLPRMSGRPIRTVGPVRAQLAVHALAVVLIVPALGRAWPSVFVAAALLVVLAMVLFAAAVWPSLAVPRRPGAPIAPGAIEVRR